MRKFWIAQLLLCFCTQYALAQVFTNKEVGEKNAGLIDSLKTVEWPYLLPIWGQKVTSRGFNLPLPVGASINYLYQSSDIAISNLRVGFNGGELFNIDNIIRFNEARSNTNALNFRPDFWLFPFLNIYGILAVSQSQTDVNVDIFAPGPEESTLITSIETGVDFNGTSLGFGLTPTAGIGWAWFALDMNFTWTDIPELADPAFAFVFGPRIGTNIRFKQPDRSLALWIGGFRLSINTGTKGSIPLNSLFNTDQLVEKIDNGFVRLDEAQMKVEDWWNGLTPAQQRIFQNQYDKLNNALSTIGTLLTGLNNAVDRIDQSTVEYSLDKRQANLWNFLVGAQFQLNKNWMFRAETGFLSKRTQVLAGIQYRFGF